ncbi:Uncharacterised protein [[Clostridium] sordellii]|uniref:DUF5677 domain-containing protein n=1 Tax=Paraclostridium sordellii TaxID=1505 RepID=UPI0005DB13B8|nr:DUF5677 domain-containing protein [Paeniclostridium sordellii]CEP94639.1 Uncharacterised protein [[Clostridium] sordellii] [Paeniclostridium sordellii]
MDKLFMEEIKSKSYNDLLERTTSHIDEICVYGQYLFNLINDKGISKKSDTVIIFIFRELLETADGIKSLFQGSSINISDILIRNLFELSLSLNYILSEKDLIDKRALSYEVSAIRKKIDMYEKLNVNYEGNESFKKILGDEILGNIDADKLYDAAENLKSIFDKYPEYREVDEYRTAKKNKINKKRRFPKDPKWYQIYSEASSIRALSRLLDMEKYYLTLYNFWSNKVHGGSAMDGFIVVDNEPIIYNPKIPKKPSDVANKLELIQTFMSMCYRPICTYFLSDEDCLNMAEWHLLMREKEDKIKKCWRAIKFKYED